MDFDLNIEENDGINAPIQNSTPIKKTEFLQNIEPHEISRFFSNFIDENRALVVPIGFPQAGKSLFFSSLIYFAKKGSGSLFRLNILKNGFYEAGHKTASLMVDTFSKSELYSVNQKGSLDLVGLDITPNKPKLPQLKLAFLDLAGEDIQGIKTSNGAKFTDKINAVFNGVKIRNSPIVFVLITPFIPLNREGDYKSNDRNLEEDILHYDFLNHIRQNEIQLLQNATFFIVVSQWDLNTDPNLDVETYIQNYRPSIYNYVKNLNVVWGKYSVGKLLVTRTENNPVAKVNIVEINIEYPNRFWKKLYHVCTGKELDRKTIWEKLFG
jgi:hypothetical protein